MKVNYNSAVLDVKNVATENANNDFLSYWNDYTIEINHDPYYSKYNKKKTWFVYLSTPKGGCDVAGAQCFSIKEGLQIAFDNISIPPMSINDPDEDE